MSPAVKPESFDLPPLHCSLDEELGDYYQDIEPAIVFVESGYHGGLDERGIPVVRRGNGTSAYNATITAQYALANLIAVGRGEDARADRARLLLDWLVENQERVGPFAGCWVMRYDNPKYGWLRSPWASALTVGNAISALLRGWQRFGSEEYRQAAHAAYDALHREGGWVPLLLERDGILWYEEYPAAVPLHVLNGHVYTLLGVADYARAMGDAEADTRWRRAAATTSLHLDQFDLGYWSAYELRWREPASLHYQKNVHVPLLQILGALTGEEQFSAVAGRWAGYARSIPARARWQVSLRTHRWQKQADDMRAISTDDRSGHPIVQVSPASQLSTGAEIRPFPFPYRAALTISNDADLLTVPGFRRLYRFLVSEEETEWGAGLGLDLGGSFFMFSSPLSPNTFTVFQRLGSEVTEDGEYILECARTGLLDVLHTYGCFTEETHFTRELAERALDTLRSRGVRVRTWVNHGPPTNVQCIGSQEGWQGDAPGTPGYHADLTTDYGIRWIWTGAEITDAIALDRQQRDGGLRARLGGIASHLRASSADRQHLVAPLVLRDGRSVRHFFRYGGLDGRTPVLDDLPAQLDPEKLAALVQAGGFAVVYQHLAVRRVRAGFGPRAYGPVGRPWFKEAEVEALRNLARLHRDGEIWVAPTTTMLRYRDLTRNLNVSLGRERDRDVIALMPRSPEPTADPLSVEDLAEITIYCERPEATQVYIDGPSGAVAVPDVRANPADGTGRTSVTLMPRRPTKLP